MAAGARVLSASHINSYACEASAEEIASLSLAELLSSVGSADREKPMKGFVRNPKLVKGEALEMQRKLDQLHHSLDAPGRMAQADAMKAGANQHFSQGSWNAALVGYLAGIWLLRRGSSCPIVVAHAFASHCTRDADFKAGLAQVQSALGAGAATLNAGDDSATGDADAAALRMALHLNLAAAALKISEWEIAKAACEYVISVEALHAKALFRLAKAHEGQGEVSRAISVVMQLLKSDSQNKDARTLLDVLRKRQAEEKGMFGGLFTEKAGDAL
ncbi:hypothetical protein AB1Y20_015374 [Prymnesium parvum]|uniref:Uncharacterized protein n=1 Tax=Prymnesium parvum TaxID=97485 RepID=A0AB34JYA4_PRYPA|eukprot:CAMPEP_0182832542 /NCGR_PEP_ID=MMETSP0006_2-20121128/19775_1 /TAXON_ID=97485 /ORGANISM="Prymnesium parvum, Strain Texoma1" /LENGTH=273 /DNA_ID=CAMNT_0024960405 /DNA_START=217 /DNA_END=1038 /DNA_ORIENTATION=+